ncbi:MAG: hypothetical protein PHC53_03165 [Patescibacteria group bacterium]|nr:hypothetical protein [Patescibacteria group bacterium]
MNIRYYQKDGRVGVVYSISEEEEDEVMKEDLIKPFPAEDPWIDDIDMGLVPLKVQEKGQKHIREYARRICHERHAQNLAQARKDRDEKNERIRRVNRVISTQHEGMTLKGRIVKHESGGVYVKLEDPFVSEKGCVFKYPTCYAESVMGRHVFDRVTGELTSVVLEDSRHALIQLYKAETAKRKHGKVVNLVETLNGDHDDENDS